jgi:hypothetical protein
MPQTTPKCPFHQKQAFSFLTKKTPQTLENKGFAAFLLVRPTGFEPATFRVGGFYSHSHNLLSRKRFPFLYFGSTTLSTTLGLFIFQLL